MNDAEMLAYVRELAELELQPGHDTATLHIGPYTAFTLVGLLQLVDRHPGLSATQHDMARTIIAQLSELFDGTPGAEILALGNNPEHDVPAEGPPRRPGKHRMGPESLGGTL